MTAPHRVHHWPPDWVAPQCPHRRRSPSEPAMPAPWGLILGSVTIPPSTGPGPGRERVQARRTSRLRSPKRTVDPSGTGVATPGTQRSSTPAVTITTPLVECRSATYTFARADLQQQVRLGHAAPLVGDRNGDGRALLGPGA